MDSVTIDLVPVDSTNWRTATSIQPAPGQESFVAPNWYSLLEAVHNPLLRPLLAFHAGEPVGFVMYGFEPEDDQPWIYRLMVVEEQQGRGFGREIMRQVIALLRREYPRHQLAVSYEPDNERAAALYDSLGFRHHGVFIDGEKVVQLPAASPEALPGAPTPFDEFLTNYLRAWRNGSLPELAASIAPAYQAREYTGEELVDFGFDESVEGWRQGFEHVERTGAEWQLQVLQLLPLRPDEVLVLIRAAVLQGGAAAGGANLFVQTFRRQETGAWQLVRSYIEAGVEAG